MCVLFAASLPSTVSLLSARTVLDNIDTEKYRVFPVGIRKDGRWFLHTGENWELTEGTWEFNPGNKPAFLSPDGNFGLVTIAGRISIHRNLTAFSLFYTELTAKTALSRGWRNLRRSLRGLPYAGMSAPWIST